MKRSVEYILCRLGWSGTLFTLGAWMALAAHAAPGSWVTESTGVRLFTPGRMVESKPLAPTGTVSDQALIRHVRWRYRVTSDWPRPEAWLCHPKRCIELPNASGRSDALEGLPANVPLSFRFRLPKENRPDTPRRVEGLQIIVDYD